MTRPDTADPGRRWPSRLELALLALVFALHALVCFKGFGELFLTGHQGYNGALRSGFARQYLDHGLAATAGLSIKNQYPIAHPKRAVVHWHHPPLVNLLVAGSFGLFGESEASARAVPVAASLASFLLLYLLVRRRYGPAAALASAAVFALLPMQVEYGKMVNYEPLVVCFSLLALLLLDRVRRRGGWPAYVGLAAACGLAGCSDWPGLLFALGVCAEALLRRPRKLIAALIAGGLALGLGAVLWVWLDAASGSRSLGWLADFRVGADTELGSLSTLLDKAVVRLRLYFGWITVITGLAWIAYEAVRSRRLDPVVLVFLPAAVAYVCVFRQGAVQHSYFLYYLVPPLAVAAGVGAVRAAELAVELGARARASVSGRLVSRLLSPAVLAAVVGLAWGAGFVVSQAMAYGKAHRISYRLPSDATKVQREPPELAEQHLALLGQLVRSLSEPDDTVLCYRRPPRSVPFSYYLWRRTRPVSSFKFLSAGQVLLARERRLDRRAQARLAQAYPVVRALGFLIYDLEGVGRAPHVRQLDYRPAHPSWWWWYSRSSLYPPHELVENPAGAAAYLSRLSSAPSLPDAPASPSRF